MGRKSDFVAAIVAAVALGPGAWARVPDNPAGWSIGIEPRMLTRECGCKGCAQWRDAAPAVEPDGWLLQETAPPPAAAPGAPNQTDVLNNNLSIEVTPGSLAIAGRNLITIRAVTPVTSFVFVVHRDMVVSSCVVTDSQGSYSVTPVKAAAGYNRTITMARTIPAGEQFTVEIVYSGTAISLGLGSFFSSNSHVMTLSQPFYAGTWWPCKDGDVSKPGDNSDKATLDIAITAPAQYQSTANGVLVGIDDLPGDKRRYRFSTTYPMSTYLVAFATGVYTSWTEQYVHAAGSMPIEFNVFTGQDSDFVRAELAKVKTMLATFAEIFGEYPFIDEKYGIYQFAFGGGMEHQTNSGQGIMFIEWLNAHELAHQWWGDFVTCKTWSDTWLNEGFATYAEALWEERKPGADSFALRNAMAVRRPSGIGLVYKFSTVNSNLVFDQETTYLKGAWVLHMLRGVVGDTTFFKIVKAWREIYGGGAATTREFVDLASAVAERNLKPVLDPWLFGQGPPTYRSGFTTSVIDGRPYMRVRIEQTQQQSYPTFDMPLDIRSFQEDGQADFVVRNFARSQWYLLPLPSSAPWFAAQLDPDQWVLANQAVAAYAPGPPKIVRMTPGPGELVPGAAAPLAIEVVFSDPVVIADGQVALTRAGAAGPEAVAFTLGYDGTSATARLEFASPLGPGSYTVLVSDGVTSQSPVYALDGETTGSLPSGDGVPGGIALVRFTVLGKPCPGDFDQNGEFEAQDVFAFLPAWFARNPQADLNESGTVSVEDVLIFLAAWLSRCE